MRSKLMLLTAFLFFATGIIGCDLLKTDADHIKEVIKSIEEYKAELKTSLKTIEASSAENQDNPFKALENIKEATNEFVLFSNNLKKIDTSNCPVDFQICFNNYASKIANFSDTVNQMVSEDTGLLGILAIVSRIDSLTKEIDEAEEELLNLVRGKYKVPIIIDSSGL